MIVAIFLGIAFVVSLWQVRGALFSLPLAVLPLAEWVGSWRERAQSAAAPPMSSLRMVAAWLASINLAWSGRRDQSGRQGGTVPNGDRGE